MSRRADDVHSHLSNHAEVLVRLLDHRLAERQRRAAHRNRGLVAATLIALLVVLAMTLHEGVGRKGPKDEKVAEAVARHRPESGANRIHRQSGD